jgi:preprotein translocase subunit SecB
MPTEGATETPQLTLVRPPELWGATFNRHDPEIKVEEPTETQLAFDLALSRISKTDLGVQLGVEVQGVPQLELRATFRAIFRYTGTTPDQVEAGFRQIGAHVAPTVIYPYARECLSSLLSKAGITGVQFPIMNFATFFDPAEVNLPPPDETETETVEA